MFTLCVWDTVVLNCSLVGIQGSEAGESSTRIIING